MGRRAVWYEWTPECNCTLGAWCIRLSAIDGNRTRGTSRAVWCIEDDSESTVRIPLPYAITPQPYGPDDKPWNWDATYSLPDEYGRFGVNDMGSSLLQQMDPSIAAASVVAGDCSIQ